MPVGNRSQWSRTKLFQSRIPNTRIPPKETNVSPQVKTYCQDPFPGGGQTRNLGTRIVTTNEPPKRACASRLAIRILVSISIAICDACPLRTVPDLRRCGLRRVGDRYALSLSLRSSCALMATITVLADINAAPIAGESKIPNGRKRPAAAGMARML